MRIRVYEYASIDMEHIYSKNINTNNTVMNEYYDSSESERKLFLDI